MHVVILRIEGIYVTWGTITPLLGFLFWRGLMSTGYVINWVLLYKGKYKFTDRDIF